MVVETLGNIFSSFDIRDYKATKIISKNGFANEFELKIPRVKNQGNVSACGANVLSCIVEYFNYKQHGIKTEMSVGYIYGNREETTHKGKGMILRDTLNAEMEILKQIVIICHIKYGDIKCSLTKLFR